MNLLELQNTPIPSYKAVMDEVEAGRVSFTEHPTLPLRIFNYTPDVQFKKLWNEINIHCRAIIYDLNGNLVSYAYPKYFNWEELEIDLSDYTIKSIDDKLDGSLITAFFYNNELVVTSRGSFTSTHAEFAAKWIKENNLEKKLWGQTTHIFEYIGPSNIIVVRYPEDKLILTGLWNLINHRSHSCNGRNKEAKYYFRCATPKNYTSNNFQDITDCKNPNREGYIVTLEKNNRLYRFKIKSENYKILHRLVTGDWTNKRLFNLWYQWYQQDLSFLKEVPDEWYKELLSKIEAIDSKWQAHSISLKTYYDYMKEESTILDRGQLARKYPDLVYLLPVIYNQKNLDMVLLTTFAKQYDTKIPN